jgi:mycothiol synthase
MHEDQLLTHGPGGWTATVPSGLDATGVEQFLDAAVQAAADQGGGELRCWIHGDGPSDVARVAVPALEAAGFTVERTLHQLRRPLPVDDLMVPTIPTRPFVPGKDDDAWLAVNNRAFATHPEQGAWSEAQLQERMREPWFDPDGFLLHDADGELVGFCWTKVHADTEPPMGEIYVIAVDPAAHQRGLGKGLVVTGLDHLAERGLRTGMLYVDASNGPATHLYARLGFTLHHEDHAYLRQVAPA